MTHSRKNIWPITTRQNFSIRSDAERICCSQWPSSRPPSVAAAAAEDGTRLIRADQGHLQYGGVLTILPKKFLATHITRELDPPLPDARTHLPSSPSTVLPLALHLLLHYSSNVAQHPSSATPCTRPYPTPRPAFEPGGFGIVCVQPPCAPHP